MLTTTTPLHHMLTAIRNAPMSTVDRELMRIPFAQLDAGVQAIHMPQMVVARVRDIYARLPK